MRTPSPQPPVPEHAPRGRRPKALLAAATAGTLLAVSVPSAAVAAERPARERLRTEQVQRPAGEDAGIDEGARPADLETARRRCLAAVERRLTDLDTAAERLAAAPHVTDEHERTLAGILAETSAGLERLVPEITAATHAESLRAHCSSVFEDYRVYALVLPRTRLVVASDVAVVAADRFEEVADRLAVVIGEAAEAGHDTGDAETDLAAMRDEIDTARDAASRAPGSILGLTAADWNADHEVLTPARQALRSARVDLRDARRLAGQIKASLRS